MKHMTKEQFFRHWKETSDEHDLEIAEALVDVVGDFSFSLDDVGDREDDKDLRISIDNALGAYITAKDELLDIFMDLEEEFDGDQ